MSAPATLQDLQHCLARQLQVAQRFIVALQAETQALGHIDQAEHLHDSTQNKLACVQEFDTLNQARNHILQALGYPANDQGLATALAAHPALADTVNALRDAAAHAQLLNAQNGVAIDTYLRHTQQALDEIQRLTGQGDLYNAKGQAKAGRQSVAPSRISTRAG